MNKNKRIVHLTSVHKWDDTRILKKECVSLVKCGFNVSLVCTDNTFDYKEYEGVKVYAVRRFKSRIYRVLLSPVMVVFKAFFLEGRTSLFHIHDPELLPLGLILRCFGFRVIVDVHENYPKDIQSKKWIPSFARELIGKLVEVFILTSVRFSNGIVFTDDVMLSNYGGGKSKAISVRNFLDINREFEKDYSVFDSEPHLILFFGGVMRSRAVEYFVQSLNEVGKYHEIKVVLAGNHEHTDVLREVSSMPGWQFVENLGRIDRKKMEELYRSASLSINLFADMPNNYNVRSNRVFEAMGCSTPVLVSNFGDWPAFIQENQCGLVAVPSSPSSIAKAMIKMLESSDLMRRMARNGHKEVLLKFDWANEESKLTNLYNSILFNKLS